MEFPKLKDDTNFPVFETAQPYALYKNNFDYTRWVAGTEIKLCNVLWNSDYDDVVCFETNAARDEWFENLTDFYTVTLDSDKSYVPEDYVKISIPYDVACRYNYMVISIPTLPGSVPELDFESDEIGIRKWYFFIDSIDYRAPNTTACRLSLDVWTQYQNDIEIKYMVLERGHAPVAYSDVDIYLSNPIENNDYLLAPDVTPANAQIVRDSKYIPFGNGVKYVCFASVCPPEDLQYLGTVTHNDPDYTFGQITYSDVSGNAEWNSREQGYQLGVSGFKVGDGDNYSNLRTMSAPMPRDTYIVPNGSYMYAISASNAVDFLHDIQADCPTFLRTIRACFMVDENMLSFGAAISFHGYNMYSCIGTNTQENIVLTKEMFNFPNEYKHFAKLYTFPYSELEITDNNGEVINVRVENTSSIVAHKEAWLAFPYLNARVWFDGINGSGSSAYTWVDMNGTSHDMTMPNSDWSQICFDLNIPCYALFMDASTAWKLDNWYKKAGVGAQAIAAYKNAVQNANTPRANAIASNDTMASNTLRDATTYYTNTDNTCKINAAFTSYDIWANDSAVNVSNRAIERVGQNDCEAAIDVKDYKNGLIFQTLVANTSVQTDAVNTEGVSNFIGGVSSGAIAGAAAGSAVPFAGTAAGAIIGGLGGAVMAGAQYSLTALHLDTIIGADTSLATYNRTMNNNLQDVDRRASVYRNRRTIGVNECNQYIYDYVTQSKSALLNGGYDPNNPDAISGIYYTNMDVHYTGDSTSLSAYEYYPNGVVHTKTDNVASKGLQRTNAENTANTMYNNADDTRNTGNNNAGWTRWMAVDNAKRSLEAQQLANQADFNSAKNGKPIQLTPELGDMSQDINMRKGIQFKIKTMSNGDIKQVGDIFTRFGYYLNQIWNIAETGLCLMNHFTYWKASDIWIDDRKSSNNRIQQIMIEIFKKGVTVWNNPNEIGRINPNINRGDVSNG